MTRTLSETTADTMTTRDQDETRSHSVPCPLSKQGEHSSRADAGSSWNDDSSVMPGPLSMLMAPFTPEPTTPVSGIADVARHPPLALRNARTAPGAEIPPYAFDHARQVATEPDGRPLAPRLAKDWTTYESTHTDGDGGDNETWSWEEQTDTE